MRGVLAAYGVADRRVVLADSFEGLPPPDVEHWAADRGDVFHLDPFFAVSQGEVEANFRRYGLLDSQVVFVGGWFSATLPTAPVERLAILRLMATCTGRPWKRLPTYTRSCLRVGFVSWTTFRCPDAAKR